ncbi:Glycosyl transferase, family 39 [Acidilobus saccharovorans 345-15]|uniref:Glycosyl transferase, family 39 n=1 Tax=Acidilobus saccharovorans (strain DSM 16705 / JCM 18335 / VKM B-2471 / 345-15) TaxID=666510 RepID=D9Q2F2_ACIS3|nr:glycosyltransferase family 39 protein [Acidilobus saccharovorans]ADL19490.1 Glycosyl transferase, family 39 [Acidilobus saccharovorans 345-15]
MSSGKSAADEAFLSRRPSKKLTLAIFLGGLIIIALASYRIAMKTSWYASHVQGGGYDNAYVSDEIYYVDAARRILVNVFGYHGRLFPYSGETASNYYNFEHPPLGKYIIALSMALLGDKPFNWRVPSIIMASLIPLIIYIGLAWGKDLRWIAIGAIAGLAASADHILIAMGSVAMLDIYAAFFLSLAVVSAFREHYYLSAVFEGLAWASKETALPGLLALLILVISRSPNRSGVLKFLKIFAIVIGIFIITYIPLFIHFGVIYVIQETLGGYKWDLVSRPPGPPTSTPSGWFFNVDPFVLSYSPLLAASMTIQLELVALVAAIALFVVGVLRERALIRAGSTFFVAEFVGLWAVYIAGNHTLYSFYSVVFTPAMAVTLAEVLDILSSKVKIFK